MFSASLVDSSNDAYVCEPSPSGVCETDSVIGLEIFIQLFFFSKITIGSYRIIFVSFYLQLPSLTEDTVQYIHTPVGQTVYFGACHSWFHIPRKT